MIADPEVFASLLTVLVNFLIRTTAAPLVVPISLMAAVRTFVRSLMVTLSLFNYILASNLHQPHLLRIAVRPSSVMSVQPMMNMSLS